MAQEKQLTKKERREQIKKELEAAKNKAGRGDFIFKIIIGVVLVVLVGGFVWLYINAKNNDRASVKELGQVTCVGDDCVRTHIDPGSSHEAYNSNPPSNGPHYPTWAPCKVYDSEIIDEQAIHSLEHGSVWITYKDKNDTALRDQLKDVIKERGGGKIILSPRSKNDSAIALVSWGRILKLESFDKQKITDYIKLYRNGPTTPEPLANC